MTTLTHDAMLAQIVMTFTVLHSIPLSAIISAVVRGTPPKIDATALLKSGQGAEANDAHAKDPKWDEKQAWTVWFYTVVGCVVGTALEVATSTIAWNMVNSSSPILEWCFWVWVALRLLLVVAKRAWFDGQIRGYDRYGMSLLAVVVVIAVNVTFVHDTTPDKTALAVISSVSTALWLFIFFHHNP